MVSDLLPSFLVSGTLEAPPVFSYARPLQVADAAATRRDPVPETSAASYRVAPARRSRRTRRRRRAARRRRGGHASADRGRHGRVIVLGDADFATNGFVDYLGNKDLLVNSANWLARDESLIAARAQQKEAGREQFFVTETQGRMAFWLAAVVQPAVFFAMGIVGLHPQAHGMSWRRVAVIYAVLGVLLIVVLPLGPAPSSRSSAERGRSRAVAARYRREPAVAAVVFRARGLRVRAVREDGRWRIVEPAGAAVPSDLDRRDGRDAHRRAAVGAVTEGGATDDLAAFGLAAAELRGRGDRSRDAGGGDIRVVLGAANPTKTAVYARRGDDPRCTSSA